MIEIEKLKPLSPPYEIFEFVPCQPAYFRITQYEVGKITITPRWPGAPPTKEIACVRLHVDPSTKPYFPHYWDITPSRLVHQLAGLLTTELPPGMYLRIHRDIPGPRAHFSVSWAERPP